MTLQKLMAHSTVASLDVPTGPGEEYFLPGEKLIHGNPLQTLWLQYTDSTGQFHAGVWRSEPGKWRVAYTEEEYCQMLEGVCSIVGSDGRTFNLKAGDCFVIPRGFVGTWEVVETTVKRFVIFEPAT